MREAARANSIEGFLRSWQDMMLRECHRHAIWQGGFARTLRDPEASPQVRFQLAAVWAVNMVRGSYCFPGYVAMLAGRAESDAVRHGLLENAWDESGGSHHAARSHFWLAVRLARLLGLSEHEVEVMRTLADAEKYTQEHHWECMQGEFDTGLGMVCLIEEFTTGEFSMVFEALLASCQQAIGMSQSEFVLRGGAEYFTANISDDERHRREMPRLVATMLMERGIDVEAPVDDDAMAGILRGVRRSLELRGAFFDGIYDYVMSGGTFRGLAQGSPNGVE